MQCIDIEKKLFKANEIMAKIAADYEHITPVTLEDQALFETFFAKEERHTYGNSWIYVTQGVYGIGPNNLGYKYYDGENLCMLCAYPKVEDPNIIMLYWIRPLGNKILEIVKLYSDEIKAKLNVTCYVKKLFKNQYDRMLELGFNKINLFPWHSATYEEDDTLPELIFDRQETLSKIKKSGRRKSLGNAFREALKLAWEHKIELTEENFSNSAREVTRQYFNYLSKNPNKINISNLFDYFNPTRNEINNVFRKVVLLDDVPVGFFVSSIDREKNTTNIYAVIALRNQFKYLSDYIFMKIFENAKSKYINFGGSEDEGIHHFKFKYCPIKKQKMYWVTNHN